MDMISVQAGLAMQIVTMIVMDHHPVGNRMALIHHRHRHLPGFMEILTMGHHPDIIQIRITVVIMAHHHPDKFGLRGGHTEGSIKYNQEETE